MWLVSLKRRVLEMCVKNYKSILQMCMWASVVVVKYFCSILRKIFVFGLFNIAEKFLITMQNINCPFQKLLNV